ncbi:MAG: hypothetical protein MMC33_009256 [Icmadophila ericetorum]|nr:hypothetical protein [Icmadophila ericetorum]
MILRLLLPRVASVARAPRMLIPNSRPLLLGLTQRTQWQPQLRTFAAKTEADEILEELQELYATAKDEFEIALEETEKKTVYAADDRAAAHEELAKLKKAYEDTIKTSSEDVAKEIQMRVGQRIRELENGIEVMDEKAKED